MSDPKPTLTFEQMLTIENLRRAGLNMNQQQLLDVTIEILTQYYLQKMQYEQIIKQQWQL